MLCYSRAFPYQNYITVFQWSPPQDSHQSGRIGIPSHGLWGIQWNEVRAAMTHTSFTSCLLKGIFCWWEERFGFFPVLTGHSGVWRQQPCCHPAALRCRTQLSSRIYKLGHSSQIMQLCGTRYDTVENSEWDKSKPIYTNQRSGCKRVCRYIIYFF